VHVLAADQHHLSRQFATPAEDKFDGVPVTAGRAGLPIVAGALAVFQCRLVRRVDAGDHVILLGEVEEYSTAAGQPLFFHTPARTTSRRGIHTSRDRHPHLA
jgi:flavin reductase (DIM6/NTAB) family NADH-FMN oxidoreductase RutF